jgi:CPA1 family monovalent cation:H+ antiporter
VDFVLGSDVIYHCALPLLLFEAAFAVSWKEMRRDLLPVLVLASLGVLVAALVVSAGMRYALGWPWSAALVFGSLIAATDPVAVIAMFKDAGQDGRFRLLVESESLLNDSFGAVLFAGVLAVTQGGGSAPDIQGLLSTLLVEVGGGFLAGMICAVAVAAVSEQTTESSVHVVLTAVAAYGSFLLAENFHASGVTATVVVGLFVGILGSERTWGSEAKSARQVGFVSEFWDLAAFVANSLLFLLVGLEVARIAFGSLGVPAIATIVALVLLGRAAAVYPVCLAFRGSRWRIPAGDQHVLWWGGLRGVLGLALALSLPPGTNHRSEIIIATFAVVVASVLLQGGTMPAVLKRTLARK